MRWRWKRTIPYLFLASVILLVYREIERINDKSDDRLGPVKNSAGKQPLVAGIGAHQERLARRSPGDDGAGADGKIGGARGPLWQKNKSVDQEDQVESKYKQRHFNSDRDAYNVRENDDSKTQQKASENVEIPKKNRTAEEREKPQQQVPVLSIEVNKPVPAIGQPNPLLQIKDLSSLVAHKSAPASNFTIIVHNPGDDLSESRTDKQTELSDVFIGVKTTEKYHRKRLQIILDTWYSLAPEQTYFFSDVDDAEFQQKSNGHMINTQCQGTHSRLALCCKTSVMFNMFYKSNKRWLCHVDDDNYLNVPELLKLLRQYDHTQDYYLGRASLSHPIEAIDRDSNQKVSFWFATGGAGFCVSRALADKMAVYASSGTFERLCNRIRLPDDVTVGFISEVLLKQPMTKVQGFNSHLQTLRSIRQNQLQHQITLSYSITDKRVNIINMPSSLFNITQDPTRFRTFHCTYFRGFGNCPPTR